MIKSMFSIVAVLSAVVVLQGALSSGAKAQGCFTPFGCAQYSLLNAACLPQPPPGVFGCQPSGLWSVVCLLLNSHCTAAAGPAETAPGPCTKCLGGGPISLVSGNTFIEDDDVRIPGLSNGLTLVRTWNSMWPSTQSALQIGMFGPNWRSNYEERVFLGSDNYMKYGRGDGSFWSFGYDGGVWNPSAPASVSAALTQGTAYWTITFQNGEQRLFDNLSGKLIAIVDRNGNTTQLSYDSLGRLVTVTDPASRHLYFSYGTGSGSLVTGVTSDVGLSLSYSYDGQGRLVQYTKPDQTTVSFQYDSNSMISAVLDQNGKVLESHTYDTSGRGLTSSRAGGVDALAITYPN
jgi:YD repeat-containing protein